MTDIIETPAPSIDFYREQSDKFIAQLQKLEDILAVEYHSPFADVELLDKLAETIGMDTRANLDVEFTIHVKGTAYAPRRYDANDVIDNLKVSFGSSDPTVSVEGLAWDSSTLN